jgi:hypothetical protein
MKGWNAERQANIKENRIIQAERAVIVAAEAWYDNNPTWSIDLWASVEKLREARKS